MISKSETVSGDGVRIVKADGTEEMFDRTKLLSSLMRSGASAEASERVTVQIEKSLKPATATSSIYRKAFSLLARTERPAASRYSLKRAILDLGPSGFPFEDYMAALFVAKGYTTNSRVLLTGACARHEVDLVATKEGKCIAAEIKFHNHAGLKSDLKVALYIHARFLDLIDRKREQGKTCDITEGWAITNTKFTKDAREYAICAGLKILDWSHPSGKNLQDWIEETRSHPLTCLTTLSKTEKTQLLTNGTVLCNTIGQHPSLLHDVGVGREKVDSILKEVENLCTV